MVHRPLPRRVRPTLDLLGSFNPAIFGKTGSVLSAAMLVPIRLGMMARIVHLYGIRFNRAAIWPSPLVSCQVDPLTNLAESGIS